MMENDGESNKSCVYFYWGGGAKGNQQDSSERARTSRLCLTDLCD